MLYRRAIVWLVIGTVLGCPFPCLAEAARELGGDVTVSRKLCSCCCPVQDTDPEPCPSEEGGTCLCHGAVLEHGAHVPALELQPMSLRWFDDALQTACMCAGSTDDVQPSACDFAVADSGRRIRALIESFLI